MTAAIVKTGRAIALPEFHVLDKVKMRPLSRAEADALTFGQKTERLQEVGTLNKSIHQFAKDFIRVWADEIDSWLADIDNQGRSGHIVLPNGQPLVVNGKTVHTKAKAVKEMFGVSYPYLLSCLHPELPKPKRAKAVDAPAQPDSGTVAKEITIDADAATVGEDEEGINTSDPEMDEYLEEEERERIKAVTDEAVQKITEAVEEDITETGEAQTPITPSSTGYTASNPPADPEKESWRSGWDKAQALFLNLFAKANPGRDRQNMVAAFFHDMDKSLVADVSVAVSAVLGHQENAPGTFRDELRSRRDRRKDAARKAAATRKRKLEEAVREARREDANASPQEIAGKCKASLGRVMTILQEIEDGEAEAAA